MADVSTPAVSISDKHYRKEQKLYCGCVDYVDGGCVNGVLRHLQFKHDTFSGVEVMRKLRKKNNLCLHVPTYHDIYTQIFIIIITVRREVGLWNTL